ncbi:MAG: bifunctional nicotinamidase/pyrazinamidase [Spirochaetes bacterium]|nr:MAG: bifunctional nicotinamidase/pyrazinamidase [Spirochaetota bacterium]
MKKALLIIDLQNDFCPGGALAVPEGDQIVPVLNKYIQEFQRKGYPIFASRDWHPRETTHFKEHGGQWPVHCVQNTPGAQFHPALKLPPETIVVSKGMDPREDSYSAFLAQTEEGVCLKDLLKKEQITEIYVGGLATDYCVKFTVLDLLTQGWQVKLLLDGIQAVNLQPDDGQKAIAEMQAKGAVGIRFEQLEI